MSNRTLSPPFARRVLLGAVLALWGPACLRVPAPPPATPAAPASSFDPGGWLADYDALKHYLGTRYANLEWNVSMRRLDVAELNRRTLEALRSAKSDQEALRAVAAFLAAFKDPHLRWAGAAAFAPRASYGLKLFSDGKTTVIRSIDGDGCALPRGVSVVRINGRAPDDWIQGLAPLSYEADPVRAANQALGLLVRSPFAPPGGLDIEAQQGAEAIRCHFTPSGATPTPEKAPLTLDMPGPVACAAMGFQPDPTPLEHAARRVPSLQWLDHADTFPVARVTRKDGKKVAVLRIPLFDDSRYPETCARAWDKNRTRVATPCDEQCQERFHDAVVADLLQALSDRLGKIRSARVEALLVDLTGNGGGTDWVEDVALMLASGPLECPAVARVRDEARRRQLEALIPATESCRALKVEPAKLGAIDEAIAWNKKLLAEASAPCDLTSLFDAEGQAPACSLLTSSRRTGCLEPLGTAAGPAAAGCPLVSQRARPPPRGPGAAKLFLAVNRATGSAAELFAALLSDNGAAKIVGEQTGGAGCGYVNGGNPLTLPHSGLRVEAPNCVRWRQDGSNELEGVTPDVAIPWTAEDAAKLESYGQKVLAELDSLPL